ncbi:hypothetical protein A3A84_00045 [Candidatus Collierbacteria bacterium RIFCSPLOWO2_01_FULL_50_23]|uniref:Uncharacterized protein n=2 Tax=Candidatus Collieribacteriota TaxID=1752725 RepID=A0A1F5EU30_9BACT|nr:MAG: hypothetical protein A3D09_04090 [Candidatus Collierbacteria bacterium RIFCSPHIGHO2_02_FULL_49_10]OGD71259.1 MAG: hypothetical protein A2703_00840 [Candidatus Collierbacteria bacterium RIFCSPHIGHO2_01_FULL_50_25]OGD74196.1 MAG: hypothetical protein A3A84_00045 [Candidatus Collierbacteria bacterium RIFCSPLOWO2_01_FULL_50_23]
MAETQGEARAKRRREEFVAREAKRKRSVDFEIRSGGRGEWKGLAIKRPDRQDFQSEVKDPATKPRQKRVETPAKDGEEPASVSETFSEERGIWDDWRKGRLEKDARYDVDSPEAKQSFDDYKNFLRLDREMRRSNELRPSQAKGRMSRATTFKG